MVNILIWTTLPAGIRWSPLINGDQEARLRVALLVSPRLDIGALPASTLADEGFKDFLDWPARLNGASLTFKIRKGVEVVAGESDLVQMEVEPVVDSARAPDSRFWTTIFDSATTVRSYAADEPEAAANQVSSYDAALLDGAVSSGYTVQLAVVRKLLGRTSDDASSNPLVQAIANRLRRDDGVALAPPSPTEDTIGRVFGRFRAFHGRVPVVAPALEDAAPEPLDFHELLSALQDHSVLMRKLGLVLDFEIPLTSAQLQDIGPEGRIKIDVNGISLTNPAVHFNPWTAFGAIPRVGATTFGLFHPHRRDSAKTPDFGGFRSLTDTSVHTTSHELDAVAHNLIGLAIHANESSQEAFDYSARPDPPRFLPALRQGGLAIIDLPNSATSLAEDELLPVERDVLDAEERQRNLETRLSAIAALPAAPAEASTDDVLFLEDGLVGGYRMDVRDTGKSAWRSLCQRIPTYQFTNVPLNGSELETWRPGADEGEVTKVVSSQEDSSRVRRVSPYLANWDGWSMVVPRPGKPVDSDGNPVSVEAPSIQNFRFDLSVPPKTLESKRFGHTYQLRVRTVDLVGNSWGVEEATALISSGELDVGTIESTNLRLEPIRAPLLLEDGTGLDGEKGDLLVIRQLDGNGPRESVRHIVPPDVSERLVEEHGVLDPMSDKQAYDVLKATDGGFNIGSSNSLAAFRQRSGRLRVPYLPDPLSQSVILKDVPQGATSNAISFPSQPNAIPAAKRLLLQSIILRLLPAAREATPSIRTKMGQIDVMIPPGHRVSARLCTGIPGDKFNLMWVSQAALRWPSLTSALGIETSASVTPEAIAAELRRSVTQGEEPTVTPDRDVTFVYATQRPVDGPKFGNNSRVNRSLNSVTAELVDEDFYVHVPSTGRVEFVAAWDDIVDLPGTPEWGLQKAGLAPFGYNLSEADEPALGKADTPASYWRDDPKAGGSAVKQKRRDETARRQGPTTHAFQDTKYREVVYTARAISRFGAFLPRRIRDDVAALSKTVKSRKLVILNSAPPKSPVIRYILPTFRKVDEGGRTRRHVGGGLRIYLERPWFSSGRGEKLAVVLHPADLTSASPELSNFITEWGFNPRKLGGATSLRPILEDFGGDHDRVVARTLKLYSGQKADPDVGGDVPPPIVANVSLATYDVHLDGPGDVLYCDLEVNPGRAYFPLLRLALARHQKNSLEEADLSPVVLADFIQLTPERYLLRSSSVAGKYKIAITGVSYLDVEFGLKTSVMEVCVQRRRAASRGQLSIWETASPAIITLQSERIGGETMLWTGEITKPRDENWRLALVEYEYYPVDPNARVRPGEEIIVDGKKVTRREVFSDFIEISR